MIVTVSRPSCDELAAVHAQHLAGDVPREAGARELEIYRQRVEAALNETTARAYALAGADMTRAIPLSVRESLRPEVRS